MQDTPEDLINKMRAAQFLDFTSQNDSQNKKNGFLPEAEDTNEPMKDETEDQKGWNELMLWGQANPSLVQKYPKIYPNDNLLKSKIRSQLNQNIHTQPFSDGAPPDRLNFEKQQNNFLQNCEQFQNDEIYQLELEEETIPKKKNTVKIHDEVKIMKELSIESVSEREKHENDFEFDEDNPFSDDEKLAGEFDDILNKGRIKVNQTNGNSEPQKDQAIGLPKKGRPPKKGTLSNLTPIHQFSQIQNFPKHKQLSYVQDRLRHYQQLRNLILSGQKDSQIPTSQQTSNEERPLRVYKRHRNKKKQKESDDIQKKKLHGWIRKRDISIELLQELDKKLEAYEDYKSTRYRYGQKVTLSDIGEIYHLGHVVLSSLYNQWLEDPGFRQKIAGLKAEKASQAAQKPHRNRSSRPPKPQGTQIDPQTMKLLEMRFTFAESFMKLKKKDSKIYFLQEFPKQLIFGTSKIQGESERNQINFSLMALLGITTGTASWKVVFWHGSKFKQISDIQDLFRKIRYDQDNSSPLKASKSYFILDSSVLREREKIKSIETATNSKVLFLPQMSKQLNPLEAWFNEVRNKLKQGEKSLNALHRELKFLKETDFTKYISGSDKFMNMALQKHTF